MSRGVLYVKWGSAMDSLLARSINSLRLIHPELPYHVHELPPTSSLLNKAAMAKVSPFDETLFLDTDTVILDDLSYGFRQANRFGLACCICECPWARRYNGLAGDVVEYNTGVLFFTRAAASVFDRWEHEIANLDGITLLTRPGGQIRSIPNDQAAFAHAIDQTNFNPFILPMNWNLRPLWHRSFWGPLKIWHDYQDVPLNVHQFVNAQRQPEVTIQYAVLS